MEKCCKTPCPHISIFLFLCFTTSSVALLPWRRLMEIVLLSLPSNLFYRQSLRSGLLSVLAADASLRRQAPEFFSCFFWKCFSQELSVAAAAVFVWCNQVCFQLSDHQQVLWRASGFPSLVFCLWQTFWELSFRPKSQSSLKFWQEE